MRKLNEAGRFWALWMVLVFLVIVWLSGCQSTDALERPGPSPQVVADVSLCDEAGPLVIPMGTTPGQLNVLLYAALMEVRALLDACNKGE
jgi:hypothetical protein